MKFATFATALAAQAAAVLLVFALQRSFSTGNTSGLPFIVGGIFGTQLGALHHARAPDAQNTVGVKLRLGAALAAGALLLGGALHLALAPFGFVEITVPIAAAGSAIFPFVLFNQMWRAVRRGR